ncbi:hypothetical protein [Pectobacterium zantedeschiae]|uniref:GIY-YIG domain-containing protein n=1 Tax=Pectobacterium zantedeschiae TaxID=2034769 RepID=A0A9X8JIR9_9GAMM|nr:hypothetical protein [Pectobacterium zantedeschiae]RYC44371.1 hypothetical protein CLR69_04895 [Pectobacterium zantedeschiae]RYC49530.1 hypothetical protein CTN06_00695 [Pectobacterium zantedeschiae]
MNVEIKVLNQNIARIITSPDLDGSIISFKRECISALSNLEIIPSSPMCYILYHDYYDRTIDRNEVYIGQTDAGMNRIKQHHQHKENWNKGLLFINRKPSYDFSFKLESDLIQLAKESLKFHVSNIRNENRGNLCDCQIEEYDNYLNNLQTILTAINIDILERNYDGAFIHDTQLNLKAHLTKKTLPYEIKILAGSYAEVCRLGYTKNLFNKYDVKIEVRDKEIITNRKDNRLHIIKEEYFIFDDDMNLTIENEEKMALYNFLSINGVRMFNYIDKV